MDLRPSEMSRPILNLKPSRPSCSLDSKSEPPSSLPPPAIRSTPARSLLLPAAHSSATSSASVTAAPACLASSSLGPTATRRYSVGKTTFIRQLLGRDFPGCRIGPEPTTDKFVAVSHSTTEKVVPGNALVVNADSPYRAFSKFGVDFLNKFEGSFCESKFLESVTLIDTPGILAGEKQVAGRGYDYNEVVAKFAESCDLILLLFDANKTDIGDEMRNAMTALTGNEDKVRVVLNKADVCDKQQLMRVYGSLMWSLGKVLHTPEVTRVYIGSFREDAYNKRGRENADLFDSERYEEEKRLSSSSSPSSSSFSVFCCLSRACLVAKHHRSHSKRAPCL